MPNTDMMLTKKEIGLEDWLPTVFKLGAFSCLRLDELIHIKYTDIHR